MRNILEAAGIDLYGVCRFQDVLPLIECAAQKRLPENPRSVIVCALPYYLPLPKERNISRFASVMDYHSAAKSIFAPVCEAMEKRLGGSFALFTDNSPIREVNAARLAGIGFIGDNGLLITEKYGSYIFLAELVTDIVLPYSEPHSGECLHCGECTRRCPAEVIGNPVKTKKAHCLSAIMQKKGTLCAEEERLVAASKSVWGCDVCQDCCPHNKHVAETRIELFRSSVCAIVTDEFVLTAPDRAFCWRGSEVILRNMRLCGY